MNAYINIVWLAAGVAVAAFGFYVFKRKKYNLILCIGKNKVKDKDNFSDFYGKAITFLGFVTAASSVLCWKDEKYLTVSLLLTLVGVIYFIFESFHLVKLYSVKKSGDNGAE